jgi:alpha-glucosidase
MNYVGEKKVDVIDLFIYYKHGEESSFFYEDEGDGYGYREGQSLQRTFLLRSSDNKVHISQMISGQYKGGCSMFSLHFIGFPTAPHSVFVDGKEIRIAANKSTLVSSRFLSIDII